MQIYLVGGAVRDGLLGLAIKDKDYVVIGSTPDAMQAAGFKPVGKDFPVFLHPHTHEEYALARTERKTSVGYKGFEIYTSPDVTLEEDLARRDLTINAIAKSHDGEIIDPFNGMADIQSKTLRHVSEAFAEDPVRVLRVARFAARFKDFSIAPETQMLMKAMVKAGELEALIAERVWQELAKGLMETQPSRMFIVLQECGALQQLLPELDKLMDAQPIAYFPKINTALPAMLAIDYAASQHYSLPIRFASLMHGLVDVSTPIDAVLPAKEHYEHVFALVKEVCKRLKVPNDCKALAQLVAKFQGKLHQAPTMTPSTMLSFLMDLDAIRQPARFKDFLKASEANLKVSASLENCGASTAKLMYKALEAALSVDAGNIAKAYSEPEKIKSAIFEARLQAVQQVFQGNKTLQANFKN